MLDQAPQVEPQVMPQIDLFPRLRALGARVASFCSMLPSSTDLALSTHRRAPVASDDQLKLF